MTVYKIKHIPTGLFWKPNKAHRYFCKSNLSKKGKVYHNRPSKSWLTSPYVSRTQVEKLGITARNTGYQYIIPLRWEDFEIIEFTIEGV